MLRIVLFLSLVLSSLTASAQMLGEAEQELRYNDQQQQLLDIAIWLQDQGYTQSSLIFALSSLRLLKNPPIEKILHVITGAIQSSTLGKSDWNRLANFCRKEMYIRAKTDQYIAWCEKNSILKRYAIQDSDNAYGYLYQIPNAPEKPYNPTNRALLQKAAAAKYATDYYGYGLQGYIAHLREYYRSHTVDALFSPFNVEFSNKEDEFISQFTTATIAFYVARTNQIGVLCRKDYIEKQAGFDEAIVADCIRLVELIRSEKNTQLDRFIANALIATLSQPGSDEQLEAERRRISDRLAAQCLEEWGQQHRTEPIEIIQLGVFLKMLPLLESMGEVQALAAASDIYFAPYQHAGDPKPSSCLLLQDLDIETARKMQADSD